MAELEIISMLRTIERNTLLASKNVLNLDDVALLTGFSKSHLYKLTSTRQIPYYKHNGKNMFFDRKELEEWLKQDRQQTQDEVEQEAIKYTVERQMMPAPKRHSNKK